ncbi:hypothetical protein OOT46_20040 [Aquabacterium sp. A7-Y]|uniref:hypothetical protein n=1 Tax=Aquabacterium sp. A7-Y TaxID=1349605 RepID=UPI00223E56AD|nr:hypothetical protein [Aquabacterium sp. A7-Y]MCW7540128.1 hypothetical protein [Aquabacterium sp. A7-Y]
MEREVAEVRARGVEFDHHDPPGARSDVDIVIAGGAKAAWFKDTEGGMLAIVESC